MPLNFNTFSFQCIKPADCKDETAEGTAIKMITALDISPELWQSGKTKIFFKQEAV